MGWSLRCQGVGFRDLGLGLGSRVWGLGFRDLGLGFRVDSLGCQGLWFHALWG